VHIGLDYIMWWTKRQDLPALVTVGRLTDQVPAALGQPHTSVAIGGTEGDQNLLFGGRGQLWFDLDCQGNWALEGSFFALVQKTGSRFITSNGAAGSNVVARPFFNVNAGVQDADPIAVPFIAAGSLTIDTPRTLYGGDVNVRSYCCAGLGNRVGFIFGGRFLAVDEGLRFTEFSQDLPGLGVPGNAYFLTEEFHTQNRFYGGQVGLDWGYCLGPVFLDVTGKVAFGVTREKLNNSAYTQINEPNGTVTADTNNALYISRGNAGTFSRSEFAIVPEANVKLGYDFNKWVGVAVGYTFLYASAIARPGDQVDQRVNVQPVGAPFVIPPAAAPPAIRSSGFWAQGLDVSLRFSF
jgi:hypothetical protein